MRNRPDCSTAWYAVEPAWICNDDTRFSRPTAPPGRERRSVGARPRNGPVGVETTSFRLCDIARSAHVRAHPDPGRANAERVDVRPARWSLGRLGARPRRARFGRFYRNQPRGPVVSAKWRVLPDECAGARSKTRSQARSARVDDLLCRGVRSRWAQVARDTRARDCPRRSRSPLPV